MCVCVRVHVCVRINTVSESIPRVRQVSDLSLLPDELRDALRLYTQVFGVASLLALT